MLLDKIHINLNQDNYKCPDHHFRHTFCKFSHIEWAFEFCIQATFTQKKSVCND